MAGGILKKLGGLVGAVAPTIATALGGPMAGAAIGAITKSLGVSTEQEAVAILQADPGKLVDLKQAEMQFEKDMAALDVDVYALDVKDRADARSLAKDKGIWPQVVLTLVYGVGYFGIIYAFFTSDFFTSLDDWAKGQMGILIGVLTTIVVQQSNFWFGSSKGSKDKTDQMGVRP